MFSYNNHYMMKKMQYLMLNITLFFFISTMMMYIMYDTMINYYQFNFYMKVNVLYYYFGMDSISILFMLLTTFMSPLCMLYNWTLYKMLMSTQLVAMLCCLSMEVMLMIVFLSSDMLLFFIFFEFILIPFFILMGNQGLKMRKMHAFYLLFFYTIFGSMFMLLGIILLHMHTNTSCFLLLLNLDFNNTIYYTYMWWLIFMSLSIKMPVFPFHMWLPEAHVESPTEASVYLAAMILKIGLYGMLRILMPMFPMNTFNNLNIIIIFNGCSILFSSMAILRQMDMKKMMAYSSISHMNICMLGLLNFNMYSINGSFMLMMGHGFMSAGMFFMVGIIYDRFKTKMIWYYNNLMEQMPLLMCMSIIIIFSNMSIPSTMNFIGESLILYHSLEMKNIVMSMFMCMGMFFSSIYTLWLYNSMSFTFLNVFKMKWIKKPLYHLYKITFFSMENKLFKFSNMYFNNMYIWNNEYMYTKYNMNMQYNIFFKKQYLFIDLKKNEFHLLWILYIPMLLIGMYPSMLINQLLMNLLYFYNFYMF